MEAVAHREGQFYKQKVNIKVIYRIKGGKKETLPKRLTFNISFSLEQICLLEITVSFKESKMSGNCKKSFMKQDRETVMAGKHWRQLKWEGYF